MSYGSATPLDPSLVTEHYPVRSDQTGIERRGAPVAHGHSVFDLRVAGLVGRPGDGGAGRGDRRYGDRRDHGWRGIGWRGAGHDPGGRGINRVDVGTQIFAVGAGV